MFKSTSEFSRPPRMMLIAGQNETVRKNSGQEGFVATIGLFGCVALIIADTKRNVSLTHVDGDTDLSFILEEVALMDGEFTIHLVKGPGSSELDLKVLSKLEEVLSPKYSSTAKVLESPERTVMYNHLKGVPQLFSFQDFCEISSPGYQPRMSNNLFKLGYSVQNCEAHPPKFQLRIYIRQLNQALSNHRCVPPLLVHDCSGWIKSPVHLEEDASEALDRAKAGVITFFNPDCKHSFQHVYPRYIELLKQITLYEERKAVNRPAAATKSGNL